MLSVWSDVDPWMTAFALAIAMSTGACIGWWRGRVARGKVHEVSETSFNGAVLSLLGLLLAFTFSMSLMKHEGRRQATVADSNAIGDFASCVGLLNDPLRSQLTELIRQYVERRLSMANPSLDRDEFERRLSETVELQYQMHALVREAVQNGTPVVVPLVTTFNGLTSAHASRVAAVRDRLPPHAILLLVISAVLTVALNGKRDSIEGERRWGATAGFITIVCLVVWVTLDLDQPRGGWITVSQEPLQHLLQTLKK